MRGVRETSNPGIVHGARWWHHFDVISTGCGRTLSLTTLGWRSKADGEMTDAPIDCMACIAAECAP